MTEVSQKEFQSWLDGEMPETERVLFEEKLNNDPELQAQANQLQQLSQDLITVYDSVDWSDPMPVDENTGQRFSFWAMVSKWFVSGQQLNWQPALSLLICVGILSGLGGYWASNEHQITQLQQAGMLSPDDRNQLKEVIAEVLESQPSGTLVEWQGHSAEQASIRPVNTFKNQKGQYCREFEELITINGQLYQQRAIACRIGQQNWDIKARYF